MVLFGTQIRGYRKEDVNQYIAKQSDMYIKETEDLRRRLDAQSELIESQKEELDRLGQALHHSDEVIGAQRSQIEILKNELEEQSAAFAALQKQLEELENRFLAKKSQQEQETAPAGLRSKANTQPQNKSENRQEKAEAAVHHDTNSDEFTKAVQNIKKKLFNFLKK